MEKFFDYERQKIELLPKGSKAIQMTFLANEEVEIGKD
jgi:hypothetical protein